MTRVKLLRERMDRATHARHRVLLPAEWSTAHLSESIPERRARALALLLQQMPIFIDEGELIVGSRTVFAPARPDQAGISDPSRDVRLECFPRYLTDAEERQPGRPGCASHNVAGYRKVLSLGSGGIRRQAEARLEEETDPGKAAFLRSVVIAYEGAGVLAIRYAGLAAQMAADAGEERRRELVRMAAVCRHVATEPARDLHEAIQLYWFAFLGMILESHYLEGAGRLDRALAPFWPDGESTEAQELLECLMIKFNDQEDIWQGEGYATNNVVLSGLRPDGSDATNAVTYACLDALEHLRLPAPLFAVRLHRESPAQLVRRAADLVRRGLPQVCFYNDDAFVPALAGAGFAAEAARDYALDACQDVILEGCSDFYVAGSVGLTEVLLEVLAGVPDNATFDDLLAEYRRQIADAVRSRAEGYRAGLALPSTTPLPFLSGSMGDCVEAGLDVTQGGLRYRDKGMFIMSPVNAVNALAALRQVVFQDRAATLAQVKAACRTNFAHDEPLRRLLLAAPKWGNDDDAVDLLGKELLEFACREVQRHRMEDGSRFLSGIHQPHQVGCGARVGATPDGRRAGEPFAITLSPANGTDRLGPTAVMRSVTKIDPMVCQWNHALLLSLEPSSLQGEQGTERLEGLLRAYLALGGPQLQLNVVDVATLRAAQQDPAAHRSLVVRIWGFCARFVDLSPAYQEDLIARTQHALG